MFCYEKNKKIFINDLQNGNLYYIIDEDKFIAQKINLLISRFMTQ